MNAKTTGESVIPHRRKKPPALDRLISTPGTRLRKFKSRLMGVPEYSEPTFSHCSRIKPEMYNAVLTESVSRIAGEPFNRKSFYNSFPGYRYR